MRSPTTRRGSVFAKAILVLLLIAGCITWVNCARIMQRQGWSREWGPMVPHDNFPGDCGICHVAARWDLLRPDFEYDHFAETGFQLEEAHAEAACLRCHNDRGPVGVYVERGCGGCHMDVHGGNLGIVCTECHNQRTWEPIGLIADHNRTLFPLVGAHAIAPCERCHVQASHGDFRGTPAQCHFCHQDQAGRARPNHIVNGWIVNCENCHTPESWDAPLFQHQFFPLEGGHAGLNCEQCHAGGFFGGLNQACFFCHQPDYLGAPDHVALNYSTDCTQCHNTTAWR